MKKYNKTLLAVIAIGLLLGSQTAQAEPHSTKNDMLAPIENRSNEPIKIRIAYIGEDSSSFWQWYNGACRNCPMWSDILPGQLLTLTGSGSAQVTNIEFFDKDTKKSYGWTNDLSKSDMTKIVFHDGKVWAEKNGKLV